MKRFLAILSLCVVAASCRVTNPIAPNPPILEKPTNPGTYPPGSWTLIANVTSVTPHPWWRDLTGLRYDWALTVRRTEPMRLFVFWDPTDGIEYVGSLSGQDFSLAGGFNQGSAFPLGCVIGGSVDVILTGRVLGRFSDDGRSISAEEVLSYLIVRTGEKVDVRYRWVATTQAG